MSLLFELQLQLSNDLVFPSDRKTKFSPQNTKQPLKVFWKMCFPNIWTSLLYIFKGPGITNFQKSYFPEHLSMAAFSSP